MTQNGLSAASTAMMACANLLWKKTTASSPAAARHAPNSSTPRIPSNSMAGDFKSGNWLDSTERSAFNGMHIPKTQLVAGHCPPCQLAEPRKHCRRQHDIGHQGQVLHRPRGRGHQIRVVLAVRQDLGPDPQVAEIGERESNQEGVAHAPDYARFLSTYSRRDVPSTCCMRTISKWRPAAVSNSSAVRSLCNSSRPRVRRWNMESSGATNSITSSFVVSSAARSRISASGTRSVTSM